MCGRFVIAGNKAAIRDAFSVDETFKDELKPSWKVARMQGIPFVSEQLREGELVPRLEIARWGLVPVWSKDPKAGARMINARSENPDDAVLTSSRNRVNTTGLQSGRHAVALGTPRRIRGAREGIGRRPSFRGVCRITGWTQLGPSLTRFSTSSTPFSNSTSPHSLRGGWISL